MEHTQRLGILDSSKPREERDFREIYPDLDDTAGLKVFVVDTDEPLDEYHERVRQNRPQVGSLKTVSFRVVEPADNDHKNDAKFSKTVLDYGFQDARARSDRKRRATYIKPFQTENNEKIEDFITKKRKQVEYDMDEQDFLYLMYKNELSDTLKITPEIFEIAMTVLENEWTELENRMNSINNEDDSMNNLITLGRGINNDKYGNDDGIVFGSVDDQKCAVCNDSDCDNSNAIVFCDGCDIAVHQECYGIAFIPEGQWLCRRCMINRNKDVGCVFCPSKTGAFKQLDNSLWSHVLCAIWINELYFANPIYMEPIEGIDLIPKSRWKLTCYICKQKMGACIQCCNRNCFQAYHVTCAKRAGLHMAMTRGVQGAINNKTTAVSYCDKHTPENHYLTHHEIEAGIHKTRLYYRDMKIINMQNDKLTKNKKLNNKLNIFKWKTENNTPIAPKSFSSILFEKLVQLKVEDIQHDAGNQTNLLKNLGRFPTHTKSAYYEKLDEISNDICRYWCLKREYKNGAPLIRKNNNLLSFSSILYGNNSNLEDVNQKIEMSAILDEDLKMVINLTEASLVRQHIDFELEKSQQKLIKSVYFPINEFIDSILRTLNQHDKAKMLRNYKIRAAQSLNAMTLTKIIQKNDQLQYQSINELNKDLREFKSIVLKENKATSNIVKTLNKFSKYYEMNFKNYLMEEDKINRDFRNNYLRLPIPIHGRDIGVFEDVEDTSDLSDIEGLTAKDELNLSNFLVNSK